MDKISYDNHKKPCVPQGKKKSIFEQVGRYDTRDELITNNGKTKQKKRERYK
jgi:hypothetical protein